MAGARVAISEHRRPGQRDPANPPCARRAAGSPVSRAGREPPGSRAARRTAGAPAGKRGTAAGGPHSTRRVSKIAPRLVVDQSGAVPAFVTAGSDRRFPVAPGLVASGPQRPESPLTTDRVVPEFLDDSRLDSIRVRVLRTGDAHVLSHPRRQPSLIRVDGSPLGRPWTSAASHGLPARTLAVWRSAKPRSTDGRWCDRRRGIARMPF